MSALSEEDIQSLFMWIDEIPLSRPKKNLTRDFSDGVLAAEVVKHFVPKLVDLHNYAPANSVSQKIYNWSTLNEKVFRKLGYFINDEIIHSMVYCKPGYVEYLLFELRQKIEEYLVHKPAIPKVHRKTKKPSLSKQASEKSMKSDRTSESEASSQLLRINPDFEGDLAFSEGYQNEFTNDRKEYQNLREVGYNAGIQNPALKNGRSTVQFQGGYPNISQQSGFPPKLSNLTAPAQNDYSFKNNSSISKNANSQISTDSSIRLHSKPRVMIQEPVPHYKSSREINNNQNTGTNADFGKEIADTLRVSNHLNDKMMQLKVEKLETLLQLKDKKIEDLSRRLDTMS